MSGQLRTLKKRIRSVESTKKITRAMEMVSAAKLKRFQNILTRAKPFIDELEALLYRLVRDQQTLEQKCWDRVSTRYSHPLFESRQGDRFALVLITSDTGLCGSYNTDLIELARKFMAEKTHPRPILIGIGKIGIRALERMGYQFHRAFTNTPFHDIEKMLKHLKSELEDLYFGKKVDAVTIISSQCLTLSTYKEVVLPLLPLSQPAAVDRKTAKQDPLDFIYAPSPEMVLDKLVPAFFEAKLHMIYLEAAISEQAARMRSMYQATKNAEEMVNTLVLLRNKVRQTAITKEIIEVVSGSQALGK